MRGRKTKPAAIKILDGTIANNPTRTNLNEPKPEKGRPRRPKCLSKFPFAPEAWDWCCEQLEQMKILTLADRHVIQLYAITWSQWLEAAEKCQQMNPAIVISVRGGGKSIKRNPYDLICEGKANQCRMLLAEMGLTGSARTRLNVSTDSNDDDDPARKRFGVVKPPPPPRPNKEA